MIEKTATNAAATATHAAAVAAEAVTQGFFATWSLVDDEGPYFGDTDAALTGMIFGDEHQEAVEPWEADHEDAVRVLGEHDEVLWLAAWRAELYRLGCLEAGRWSLDTGNDGEDENNLVGDEDQVRADVMAHHGLAEWPDHWELTRD